MKTKLSIYVLAIVGLLFSQMQTIQAKDVFYYNRDEKIFLEEREDKIFLKLDLTVATKEKIIDLKNDIESFELVADIDPEEKVISPFVLIETNDGDAVPSALYENCKANEMVLSATNVLQYRHKLQGLTNEFVVKLKPSSSSEQLEELALQNKCVIEKYNWITAYHYVLSVSKTSELNSLQTANLFYETGLFDYAVPEGVIINAFWGTSISNIPNSCAELFQNYPNPSGEETIIRYTLPAGIDRAEIRIFDLSGRCLKQYVASQSPVIIKSSELEAGIYFYSLVIAGKTVSTKRMIITK
jgi:hypothetical protein